MATTQNSFARRTGKQVVLAAGLGGAYRSYRHWRRPAVVRQNERDMDHLGLLMAFTLRPDSRCVDIGASVGHVFEMMVRYAPRGAHVAFEPVPSSYATLVGRFPQHRVENLALADEPGSAAFDHVVARATRSGLADIRTSPAEGVSRIEVRVSRLDDELRPEERVDLIKIDVEGAELRVLRGARRTLSEHRPDVVFEAGMGNGGMSRRAALELFDELAQHGHTLHDLGGAGPFDRVEFADRLLSGGTWNWLARGQR